MPRSRHLKMYDSLGALLRDYRGVHGIKQATLAEEISIERETLSRWERGKTLPGPANLLQLAQRTIFPFELLLRLAHDMPTLYDVTSHRMAYSLFDTDFVNRKLIQQELFESGLDTSIQITDGNTSLLAILQQKSRMYAKHRWVSNTVIERAAQLAPVLNLVAHGYGGTYVGHVLTFPLSANTYREVRSQTRKEREIDARHLLSLQSEDLRALHIYSFHASSSHVAYALVQRFVIGILKWWEHLVQRGCSITRYPVTEDGIELAKKLGLTHVFLDHAEQLRLKTEIIPQFWEASIGGDDLNWILQHRTRVWA
jgi:transcriptional regulator with XRE-family HTH domain